MMTAIGITNHRFLKTVFLRFPKVGNIYGKIKCMLHINGINRKTILDVNECRNSV